MNQETNKYINEKINNNTMRTLDIRISCDTFWNYSYRIPVRVADYYDYYDYNHNHNYNHERVNHQVNNSGASSATCGIGRIGSLDPRFVKLENYLVEYVIQEIYDDLLRNRHHRDIPLLLKKARKFHIHGMTLDDILSSSNGHDNTIYICTHC